VSYPSGFDHLFLYLTFEGAKAAN